MTCRRAVELLLDYVANDLPADQRSLLEGHFQHCPPCLIYLETYQVTIRLTRQLPREAPLPAEMELRLIETLRSVQAQERRANPPTGDQLQPPIV